ncbi:helix-turn-helix domain-containing protein [Aestuariivirga sp.]|uniref:helix-turn-helix domain-containing protein n=1 Tax=Aestuariivirga sp. TaxID=2650926 RepID=UPI0039E4D21E
MDFAGIGGSLGASLREVRKAAGITLEAAARQAELSKGYLSKVESGQAIPSGRVIVRLTTVYGVPLSDIFIADKQKRPISLVRASERIPINRTGTEVGYSYEMGSRAKLNPRAEIYFLTLPVLDDEASPRFRHAGEEIIHVLQGRVRFVYGGIDLVLGEGDCIQFDSGVEHYAMAEGGEVARVFIVNIPDRLETQGQTMQSFAGK